MNHTSKKSKFFSCIIWIFVFFSSPKTSFGAPPESSGAPPLISQVKTKSKTKSQSSRVNVDIKSIPQIQTDNSVYFKNIPEIQTDNSIYFKKIPPILHCFELDQSGRDFLNLGLLFLTVEEMSFNMALLSEDSYNFHINMVPFVIKSWLAATGLGWFSYSVNQSRYWSPASRASLYYSITTMGYIKGLRRASKHRLLVPTLQPNLSSKSSLEK